MNHEGIGKRAATEFIEQRLCKKTGFDGKPSVYKVPALLEHILSDLLAKTG